jgi:hypothetical protein
MKEKNKIEYRMKEQKRKTNHENTKGQNHERRRGFIEIQSLLRLPREIASALFHWGLF